MHIVNGGRLIRARQRIENPDFDRLSGVRDASLCPAGPYERLAKSLAQEHPRVMADNCKKRLREI